MKNIINLSKYSRPPRSVLLKAIMLLMLLVIFYLLILTKEQILFFTIPLFSFTLLVYGLNVLHEASHGNLTTNAKLNSFFAYGFDFFVGISSQQYKNKHALHHSYTNIESFDNDLETEGVLRLSPHQEWKKHHRYQHLYALPLYSLLTITWGPYYDLKRLFSGKIGAIHISYSWNDIFLQLFLKILHYSVFLLLPIMIYGSNAIVIFLLIHMLLGISLGIIFQVAHITPDCLFLKDRKNKDLSWQEQQIKTSANFAIDSKVFNFFMGGLNFQGVHHLYSNVSYSYFSEIRQKMPDTFFEYNSFSSAIKAHFHFLKKLGERP